MALPVRAAAVTVGLDRLPVDDGSECVILLHGLARTAKSMRKLAGRLHDAGYVVVNVDYPSRDYPVQTLAVNVIPPALDACQDVVAIHFVTHSMGGILLRYFVQYHGLERLRRVVMLSPPNQGSEVVDKLADMPGFVVLNGPAGLQLGTDAQALPQRLTAVNFELGVITGNHSINLILSLLIPGDDDGKVSIASARVQGMQDFIVLPVSHPFIMQDDVAISQVLAFLAQGRFVHDATAD